MAEFRDRPGYSFNPGAPPEVTDFFRNKAMRPSFSFRDVEPEEHAVAFTVAKAMQVDVLQTIRDELQAALEKGIPFEEFQKTLTPRLRRMGWWGVKEQVDPLTGDVKKVRLGSPRRLKTIYRANMRSARAAGQWQRIQRSKRALPYLVYLLGPSVRHRTSHAARNGMVLPVDDPAWQVWYPPNGFGCKCHVRQISRREAEEIGISENPDTPSREVFNPRTGELKKIPVGIDPGWESNPGLYRQRRMAEFLQDKLNGADPAIAHAAARDTATSWRVRRIHDGLATGSAPVAMLPQELADRISAKTRVVQFSDYTAEKTRRKHGEATADQFRRVAELLETGAVAHEVSGTGTESLIFEGQGAKRWRLVLKRTVAGNEIFLSTFHRSTPARWAKLLRGKNVTIVRE
ncbi:MULTISPECIES: phage minor head protein [Phaeobacter]|uniref:phage head morphogenesis protein n=1 Tax=Phaeobacter TaxID=302485 RepID=UPI003A841070